jgi:beta-glucanase (GH16 family)
MCDRMCVTVKVLPFSSFKMCTATGFCSTIAVVALVCVMLAGTTRSARGEWTNVWSDEFDGGAVDTSKWTYDTGGGGWGNNELEFYTSRTNNAYVSGGALHIRAQIENTNTYHYTSARLKTQGLYWKTRGMIEYRVRLPQGVGFWPATWMLGTNIASVGWPKCGEIDVMENKGTDAITVGGTIHYDSGGNDVYQTQSYNLPTPGDSVTNFHTYAVQWYTNSIVWLVDNVPVKTWTNWTSSLGPFPAPFDRPFFLIMNLAVGGNYVGNPSQASIDPYMPGEMVVDYVRVYDFISSTNPPTPPTGLVATAGGSQVSLSWNLSTNATSYNVKRSLVSGGPYTTIATPTSTAYADANVASCTTYYYVVSGTNSYGESANSAGANATLGPYGLAVNSGGSAASPFIADANVSGGTVAAPTGSAISTVGVTNPAPQAVYQTERYDTMTYTFGSLTTGTAYKVRLHFAEYYFNSANARKFNVTINGTQVLTNFDIFVAAGGQNKAVVREYTVTPNGSGQIIIAYTVGTADLPKSSGIEVILPSPTAPLGLTATAGDAQVALSWNAAPAATGYNLARATNSGGPYIAVTNGLTSTVYTNTSLVNGTTYYYVVSTIQGGCSSTNSTEVAATPQSTFSAWQTQYFGSPTNANAAAGADPDGDGMSNSQEFQAGTDPTNSASLFGITLIAPEGNDIRVVWMMGPGKTNALQSAEGGSLGDYLTNFVDVFTVTNTVGSTTNYLDVGAATNMPARYYRVRVVP